MSGQEPLHLPIYLGLRTLPAVRQFPNIWVIHAQDYPPSLRSRLPQRYSRAPLLAGLWRAGSTGCGGTEGVVELLRRGAPRTCHQNSPPLAVVPPAASRREYPSALQKPTEYLPAGRTQGRGAAGRAGPSLPLVGRLPQGRAPGFSPRYFWIGEKGAW